MREREESEVGEPNANLGTIDAVCGCGFRGQVTLYDIGDGPEWNCPSCDLCHCPTAVVGADGLTDAERKLVAEARADFEERHPGAVLVGEMRMK
jgi:hypothetical protein